MCWLLRLFNSKILPFHHKYILVWNSVTIPSSLVWWTQFLEMNRLRQRYLNHFVHEICNSKGDTIIQQCRHWLKKKTFSLIGFYAKYRESLPQSVTLQLISTTLQRWLSLFSHDFRSTTTFNRRLDFSLWCQFVAMRLSLAC